MQISGQIFTGVMDTDSDPRVISSEDYRYALNVLNGHGETPGSLVFARGTLNKTLTVPSDGTNSCIGTAEDKQNACLIVFVYNSEGNHSIHKYSILSETAIMLCSGSFLGFQPDWRITHAHIVNGELLYWLDPVEDEDGLPQGNVQRVLNMKKADLTKENYEYELYADIDVNAPFSTGSTYRFSITDINGDNEVEVNTYVSTGDYEGDPAAGLTWLLTNLENDYGPIGFTFESCDGCKIKISVPSDEGRFNLVASSEDVMLVGVNIYPIEVEYYHIDLLKVPPSCAPSAKYISDFDRTTNNVSRLCAQFRVRYIYDNNERSAWGPVSNIALGTGIDGEPVEIFNAIRIDFTDEKFLDPSWMTMIRAVDVAFRDGNDNDWRMIGRYDLCEIGIQSQQIVFYNDAQYSVLPSDDLSTDADLQVLKPFDFLPIKSMTMAATSNSDGSTLLFLGGNLENYDNPDCVDLSVSAVEYEDDCLIDIIGTLRIQNDDFYAFGDPDYSHYALGGFPVYLAGTPYYGISNNPADGSGDGSFIIKGVPRGHYILRVASYKCSFTNDLGPRYNMANGLEWQRTSAPCVEVAGSLSSGLCQYEREIALSLFTDPVFNLDTEAGYGEVVVQNQHWSHSFGQSDETEYASLMEFYFVDNNAVSDGISDVISAISVERQKITWEYQDGSGAPLGSPSPIVMTSDHNGYCFFYISAFEDVGISNIPINDNIDPSNAFKEIRAGDWSNIYADTAPIVGQAGMGLGGIFTHIISNKSETFAEKKHILNASAVADDGVTPLSGVIFNFTRTGRSAVTGIDGIGSISYYIPFDDAPDRLNDNLIPLYLPDFCHNGYPTPYFVTLDLEDPIDDPYDSEPFQFMLSLMDITSGRYLKGGGEYSFGIVYEDRGNRTPGAIYAAKLNVPAHVDGLTKWQMAWEINSVPPEWATHWRIVRMKNSIHSVYVQWTTPDVKYVRIPSQLENPIETSYAAGDYTHILLKMYTPVAIAPDADPATTLFFQLDGQTGYSPQKGDRVRLILNEAGAPVNTPVLTYEAEIVGQYVSGDSIYAIVPAVFGSLELKDGFLVEYFTPVTGSPEIYYEGGEDCYEILDPGEPTRRHAGQTADQDLDLDTPATGIYTGGDTYWRRQKLTQTGVYETEHQTPHRYVTDRCEDIGRAFALSTDIQQEYYYNRVRVSSPYVQSSAINGLSSFSSLDYKDINRQWGAIMYLGYVNNVLLAICKFKVQPIYINKGDLMYLSGASNVGRSDQIMELADASISDYGTHNPESVVIEGPYAYFWDKFQGAVCRYAQNGVVPITTKMVNFFTARGKERMFYKQGQEFMLGGYDREHQMYLLSAFGGELNWFTIGYDEIKGGWSSFFSFTPEAYGRVGAKLFTLYHGAPESSGLWEHFADADFSSFYTEVFSPQVTFVVNQSPALVKRFKSIRIASREKWSAPEIEVAPNGNYLDGQYSRLRANKFFPYEGQWRADFLRDMGDTSAEFDQYTDPVERENNALLRGRELRGEWMEVTIEADSPSQPNVLSRVDVYFIPSPVSHP